MGFAENLEPVALIGAGGIGKTSIALSVLHHNLIEDQFGASRRFIRCDQFPPSRSQFLARLSKAIGAGVDNPEDLTPLRPFLSSQKSLIVLDNAESILDAQGTDAQEIYAVVDELCRFKTVFVCITSRITTIPQPCKRLVVPTLSAEAACDTFYNIYNDSGRSDIIDDLLQRLDYHALSITLLATTAFQNMWDHDELVKEWDTHRAQVLRTDHNYSLAATIELSLTSPTFQKLGGNARELLGVVAFFPQGVDKKNLDWLFPTIPDRKNIFNKFCVLSLAYPSSGYITLLAPVRDYLRPQDPRSSPLLCATKDRYFTRLSVNVDPKKPSFGETEWIKSEDVNVEHLLDVFISIEADAGALKACAHFMHHLCWHKPRQTVLASKIEGLPDDHPSKAKCLCRLSQTFESLGNFEEQKRLLSQVLQLYRKQGNDRRVAGTLELLSDANRMLGLGEEGIQQARDALEIYERLGDAVGQADSLMDLAQLLLQDKQLDAAEKSMTPAINLLPKKGQEYRTCQCHRLLGNIYRSKGEREKAIHHFEVALEIASAFNWHYLLLGIHYSLAQLFRDEDDFKNAHVHIERVKSHTGEGTYLLGRATELQARIFRKEGRFEDARSEVLRAKEIYEELGLAKDVQDCRNILQQIEQAERSTSPHKPDSNREFPPLPALIAPSSYCAWCIIKHCHSDGHLQGTQPRTLIHTQFLDVATFTSLFPNSCRPTTFCRRC